MRWLLDTNVRLWIAAADRRATHLQERIVDPDNEVFVSVASYWETAVTSALGKLAADVAVLRRKASANGCLELPVLGVHIEQIALLPLIHKDPFERLLVAQAITEPMRLLTADRALTECSANIDLV